MERCSIDAAQFDELRLMAMARSPAGSLAAKAMSCGMARTPLLKRNLRK
jgi:hypothetical protein